ncbi:MAG: hypothetical protein IJS44_02520 [Clostridia bacterium]|nr:hypothetical protein [Clostridia bacterium]
MKKQFLGTVFVLCLLLSALLLAVSVSAAATEISTADELLEIMNDDTKWATSYVLTADIDLSTATNGLPQKPIGSNSSHKYTATFDGANYKITGIDIENTSTNYTGLFGYVSGTIKNLNIYGKVVSTGTYTGGLIGVATGTCRVDNVECHIDVTGSTNTTSTSNLGTGGFIGALTPAAGKNAQISNVTYYGKVIAGKFVGGILGYLQTESGTASSFSISNAVNKGTVTATGGACAGGIVGYIIHSNVSANRFFIDTCENQGEIHGINYVGGIVGAFGNAGGSTKTPFTFSKLSNRGLVKASTGIAAGIVSLSRSGVANSVIYTDCVNYGEIDAPYGAAGIISVTTTSVYAFSLIRCYNAGQYTGTTTNASYPSLPIESKDTSAQVTNVYYSGTENAAETHGAFVSDPTNKALFENFDFQDV